MKTQKNSRSRHNSSLASSHLSILIELAIQGLSVCEHLAVFSLNCLETVSRVLELLLQHLHNIHDGNQLTKICKILI